MKPKTFKIVIISLLAGTVLFIAMLLVMKPDKTRPRVRQVPDNVAESVSGTPVFRKDGELQFRDGKDNLLAAISVEIADNEEERMQGLMYRDSLPAMSGMLFMFESEEPQSFWMKNTRFSLDIIYISAERKIVSISRSTRPYSLESIPSAGPAQYVVEVPAGFASRYNLTEKCRVVF